jgi:uncharacterized OB-fold protein
MKFKTQKEAEKFKRKGGRVVKSYGGYIIMHTCKKCGLERQILPVNDYCINCGSDK